MRRKVSMDIQLPPLLLQQRTETVVELHLTVDMVATLELKLLSSSPEDINLFSRRSLLVHLLSCPLVYYSVGEFLNL